MSFFNSSKAKVRVKRSVDLEDETDRLLDVYRARAEKNGVVFSRGAAMDSILGSLLRLEPSQACGFRAEAMNQLEAAQALLETYDPKEKLLYQAAKDRVKTLELVYEFFDSLTDEYEEPSPVRVIQMYEKRLVIPDTDDWVVINEADAEMSSDATIVEVKNGERYGARHYVYFGGNDVSKKFINHAICRKCPEFLKVLEARVDPIKGPDGNYINLEQFSKAPFVGYFPARDDLPASEAPYGVVIVPDEKGDEPQN